mgnify:CR=1 FL=1
MSIKLIAADMDGTLLSSRKQLPKGFFPLVRTLKDRRTLRTGIRTAVYNLYEQFGEIADELMYISENGGMVCDGREIVSFEAMPQQLVCAAVELARGLPNVHAIASMRDGAAYEDDDPVFVENMAMYYARRKKVPDLLEAVQQERCARWRFSAKMRRKPTCCRTIGRCSTISCR